VNAQARQIESEGKFMKALLKSIKWFTLVSGILIVLLGIVMLFTPLQNLEALAIFIGISMLISGIIEIVSFFGEEKGSRSGWTLASGILTTLLGIWTIFGRGSSVLLAMLPFVFAVSVIGSSITRIIGSRSLKAEGFNYWVWVMVFGILGIILGIVLLFSPVFSSMMVAYIVAAMLISYGADNIAIFFRMNKAGNYIRKRFNEQE